MTHGAPPPEPAHPGPPSSDQASPDHAAPDQAAPDQPLPATASSPTPPAVPDIAWRRLDSRMLLVHPVLELVRFLPALIAIFVVGSSDGQRWWQVLGVAVPVVLGVMRFLTTQFRITPTQIELQRGLIGRKVLTARLDRVRAVELTSTPIHRMLGLAKVQVGTGSAAKQGDDAFTLDSLRHAEARRLRIALLERSEAAAPEALDETVARGAGAEEVPRRASGDDVVLLRFDPGWVRYAPLTSSGSVIAAGVLALMGQFSELLPTPRIDEEQVADAVESLSVTVVVPLVLLAFLLLGAAFSVLGYYVANWGFVLARDPRGRTFHVRRGLFTSTETSLERERVRGLSVDEPLGLRLAHAARLAAVVTGVSGKESGRTQLVPPAPRTVIDETGSELLDQDAPLHLPLVQHGPAARRRRWTRALVGAAVLPVVAVVVATTTTVSWWVVLPTLLTIPVAAMLAFDRYRRLGHGLTDQYLVVRSGSLRGRRDIVQRTGIIGWNIQQSWFQRRAGLVTLVATTAAGTQAYAALDVPEQQAIALADAAVPGLVAPFLA